MLSLHNRQTTLFKIAEGQLTLAFLFFCDRTILSVLKVAGRFSSRDMKGLALFALKHEEQKSRSKAEPGVARP